MNLSKSFQEFSQNVWQQTLEITVNYNPATNTVDNVVSVIARDSRSHVGFDMTKLFENQLPDQLDGIIDSVDWREAYSDYKTSWGQHKMALHYA